MSQGQSDSNRGREDPITAIWSRQSPDSIARNAKDMDKADGAIQTAEVMRSTHVPVRAEGLPMLPGQGWGAPPRARTSPTVGDLFASVLRFKWTIILVFLGVAIPAIAGIWLLIVPKYQARAEIRVQPIIPRLVFNTDENGRIPFYDSFVNTQVSLVRSQVVLQRVLEQNNVKQTSWYRNPPKSLLDRLHGSAAQEIERLRDNLSVRPRPRTEIIDISFADTNPGDARLIVDTVLDQYIKYIGEKSDTSEQKLYDQLTQEYNTLQKRIEGREATCRGLYQALGTELPQELIATKRLRLDETRARLSDLLNQIVILEWEKTQVAGTDGNDVPAVSREPNQPPDAMDAEWRRLDLDVRTTEHQIANSGYAPSHPERTRMEKELAFKKDLLSLREEQLDKQWEARGTPGALPMAAFGSPTSPVRNEVSVDHLLARARKEEQLLREALGEQQAEFNDLFSQAQTLERENVELRHLRSLFETVRDRLVQKDMERNVPGSIEIAMAAFVPSKPQQDRRVVFSAMVLFLGLGIGGGAAFLRASRDQSIYTPKDMPEMMQAPFLGHVPLIPTRRLLGRSLSDEFEQYQLSLIESVRVMRTTLLSRLNGQDGTSVLITSATTGTGKSSFTIILGKSLAQAGRSVLMIDADFHKMTLSKRFDLLDRPGLIDALGNRMVDKQHIFPTETPGLSIMPGGLRATGGIVFEEIANGAFKTCLDQLARQYEYDIILLDGSPILPVADATILAGQVSGTIMVEREHVSQRAEVAEALVRLGSTGGRLLGTVFVGSPDWRGSRYGDYTYHYHKGKESQ